MSQCIYTILYNFKELNIFGDQFFWRFEKKTFIGVIIENNEYQENQLIQNVFFCGLIFLVFVFLHFLCKFSIIGEASFILRSLHCTMLQYLNDQETI